MKVALSLLIGFVISLPAWAQELYGKVSLNGAILPPGKTALNSEIPKVDNTEFLDWANFYKQLEAEIHKRLQEKANALHCSMSGYVVLKYLITRRGEIRVNIMEDNSTNLGLIANNVLQSLEYTKYVQFPPQSKREKIVVTDEIHAGGQEFISTPKTDLERIK